MFSVLLTILGISFLLALHEAGHFYAARLAGVRVEVFSLGIGPRLFGFRARGCDFRFSLVPIGAYVKMAGEEMNRPPAPDELGAQSPGWRFLIFSGGIVANFLFAIVMIPLLFRIGVPFEAPVAGTVEAGSAAWKAGIEAGDRMRRVDGEEMNSFLDFASAVALSDTDGALRIELEGPDGTSRTVSVRAEYDEARGFPRMGIGPAVDPQVVLVVPEDTVAHAAGLREGDRLLSVDGVPLDSPLAISTMFQRLLLAVGPLPVTILRAGAELEFSLAPRAPAPKDPPRIGLWQLVREVKHVRPGPLEAHLLVADRIVAVAGRPVHSMVDVAEAALRNSSLPALTVERGGSRVLLPARGDVDAARFTADVWLAPGRELTVWPRPDGPAGRAGMLDGDVVLRVGADPVANFTDFVSLVAAQGAEPFDLLVARAGASGPFLVRLVPEALPVPDYGFRTDLMQEVVRRDNLVSALGMGLSQARRMVRDVLLTLNRMVSGQVDSRNLGGIISIGQMTSNRADAGLMPLLFFLAMISIHLGVLNLLPIPALDGGHLVFILIEKLRGRPVGERTQAWFQMLGFAAVLALILFVTWNDVRRLME